MSLTNTNGGYIDLLIKKYLGVVESSTTNKFGQEAAGNARPKIISDSQLFSQTVPNIAPSGLLSLNSPKLTITLTNDSPDLQLVGYLNKIGKTESYTDENGVISGTSESNYGILYNSKTYPWIQYIQNLK